ncbi:hypothetical protein [Collinsella tanakaei]|uniref:hypothetical protein n=1 Tax=Collinsella tanakaei TaxID=626935 RepID=UPI0025A36819|nr:hypothetical protein [Collinsella tanakaei]MDM8300904.1 hypothetical protein [Collinsella tanakaei]
MSRMTTPPPSPAIPAARTASPSRRPLVLFVACALLACTVAAVLTGCSNLGEFNESAVVRQAESYYADKYGEHIKVADLWEDRSYQLFGYRSSGQAFCTMEDGSCVLVDFEEGVVGDNRQQDEIVAAYEQRFRDAVEDATRRLESAGYTVSTMYINGFSPESDGFLDGEISTRTWQRNEEASEETGSFFYARYTDDERFFEQEASRVYLGVPSIELEISGADANYEHGFPVNVPARPAWVDPIDAACETLLPLTDNDPEVEVTVFQDGYRNAARMEGTPFGMLGELSPFDHEEPTGNWLIVDWVSLGKGIYVTSDEAGVRLRGSDMALAAADGSLSLEDLVVSGRLDERESRAYLPEAFEIYRLDTNADLFATAPAYVRDKGWFSVNIAYDNTDPETGLAQLGIEPDALAPSLYTVKANPDAADSEDEPSLDVGIMRTETLPNGFQYTSTALFEDESLMLARA